MPNINVWSSKLNARASDLSTSVSDQIPWSMKYVEWAFKALRVDRNDHGAMLYLPRPCFGTRIAAVIVHRSSSMGQLEHSRCWPQITQRCKNENVFKLEKFLSILYWRHMIFLKNIATWYGVFGICPTAHAARSLLGGTRLAWVLSYVVWTVEDIIWPPVYLLGKQ